MPGERTSVGQAQHKRWRTEKELQLIAMRVSENIELMQRFRAAIGSQNRVVAAEISKDITAYAQELDPTIGEDEGTTIVLILLKMVTNFQER
jgi:hypothetical protein